MISRVEHWAEAEPQSTFPGLETLQHLSCWILKLLSSNVSFLPFIFLLFGMEMPDYCPMPVWPLCFRSKSHVL